jgi:hypothetical protein
MALKRESIEKRKTLNKHVSFKINLTKSIDSVELQA